MENTHTVKPDIINKRRMKKNNLTAYAFLSPWIIGFLLFSGFPIVYTVVISFTDWSLLKAPKYLGLKNYINIFSSNEFWNSLSATLLFAVLGVIVTMVWAFLLALLLNRELKGNAVFQFLYFVPAVMPTIALAFAFQLIFNKEAGILNYLLGNLFHWSSNPNWLYDPKLVFPTVFFVMLYTYSTGQMLLIFRSGLKEVPKELYEASEIDGTNALQKFFHITLPYMSPVLLFNMVMSTIATLNNSFALLYPLTGGGPNDLTNVLSLRIYKEGFMNFRVGYASALSVILFLIAAVFGALQFAMSKKWVHYEN
jgi:multiple sugar transport system permease protein